MELKENIALIIYFGVFIISFFVFAIILFVVVYQRKRMLREKEYELTIKNNELKIINSIVETQESERQKIATNIHDDIGPLVSVLKFHLTEHEISLKEGKLTPEQLKKEREYVDTVLQNLRRTTHDLSPLSLLKFGVVSAIRNFICDLSEVEASIEESVDETVEINNTISINVYRVVLELINNIIKHANPLRLDLKISVNQSFISVMIFHDGKGLDNEEFVNYAEESNGLGLNSLKSRVTLLNAQLDFQKEEISKVIFIVPLKS